tara:strand:- start:545 stop:862 length:318 start_codon:yes stop_codon:yes gene_type:complete
MEIQEPEEKRRRAIADAINTLAYGLIDESVIASVENDAAEAAIQDASDKPVLAKLAFSVSWAAGAAVAEIEAKLAWSVRRMTTADCVVDPDQLVIGFEDGEEVSS